MHISVNMDISLNQALSLGTLPAHAVTFDEWRRALRGQTSAAQPMVSATLAPAELPPLPPVFQAASAPATGQERVVSAAAPQPLWTVKGRAPGAPVPVVTPDDEYPDPTAIWNASPSRVELFLSRYHHQTFTAFAIAALVLLWVM